MRRAVVLSVLLSCSVASAQTAAPILTTPVMSAPAMGVPVLGERFAGAFDVSFKPFANAKVLEPNAAGGIARLTRDDKKWVLAFNRVELTADTPVRDISGPPPQPGYLTITINKLRGGDPNADVLRNEVIDLGDLPVGVMVATTTAGNQPALLQQAIMQVTPQLYYTLTMTSPVDPCKVGDSPAAQEAAMMFKAMLDSIERVDRSSTKLDQDDRLYRTRGLFAQWNKTKILNVLVPERYLRFKREGKDVGYAFIVEQPADALPKPGQGNVLPPDPANSSGFRIGVRTHTVGDAGKELDVESWMYVNFDRRHEVWSNVTIQKDPTAKVEKDQSTWFSEVGASDQQRERVFDRNLKHDDFKEADQKDAPQTFREVDKYHLVVRNEGRSAVADPIRRELPPFYLPQALGVMLPRIVPLDNYTGYLFATYASDNRQIMLRYVDVQPEAPVKLDGQEIRAIGVAEHIGIAGSVTTHYVTRRGQYLGSLNADTKLEILPSDKATLEGIWKTLDFTPPAKKN
ncbi:MAG: hypothetical protein JWM57_4384 [Phycisphaerales bacterium]|nr:hypothetical protein [Phycisphaerales bacterium]